MGFPALEALEAELAQVFEEAGDDLDLKQVKSWPGGVEAGNTSALARWVKKANDEIVELKGVQQAANGGAQGSTESGDGARRSSGASAPGDRNLKGAERLHKGQSLIGWLKANRSEYAPDIDVKAAWNAYAQGIIRGDWRAWQQDFAAKAMSTGEPGGGYLVPDVLSASVIDRMRALSPIFVAGAQTVPMSASTLDIARITGDPAATWHAESAAITPADVTLDRVRFTARTLPFIVKVSRELAEDASNLGTVVERSIAGAVAAELTRVALRGSGTPPEPQGIRNQTGVTLTALGANGLALTHDLLIDQVVNVANANANPNAIIWAPRTAGNVAKIREGAGTGQYLAMPEPVANLARYTSTAVPTNLTKGTSSGVVAEVYTGDWTQLLVGMRTSLQIKTLQERYADTGEIAFYGWMRADVQLEHGPAFSVITDSLS